jgi:hypothetical protein
MGIRRAMRRSIRETAFRLARRDLAMFLRDHEEELLHIFREEMERLDDEFPEEGLFIDIKMVPLGEVVLRAALRAMTRFLTEDIDTSPATKATANGELPQERSADLTHS